jgi:hypothetical protein
MVWESCTEALVERMACLQQPMREQNHRSGKDISRDFCVGLLRVAGPSADKFRRRWWYSGRRHVMVETMWLDINPIVSAVHEVIKELTNVIGLLDKNVSSAIKIKRKLRRERELVKLEKLLKELGHLVFAANLPFLRELELLAVAVEKRAEKADSPWWELWMTEKPIENLYDFLQIVISVREFLEENHPELLDRKPEIFDGIIKTLLDRQKILEDVAQALKDKDPVLLDPEAVRKFAQDYKAIYEETKNYRAALGRYLDKAGK